MIAPEQPSHKLDNHLILLLEELVDFNLILSLSLSFHHIPRSNDLLSTLFASPMLQSQRSQVTYRPTGSLSLPSTEDPPLSSPSTSFLQCLSSHLGGMVARTRSYRARG